MQTAIRIPPEQLSPQALRSVLEEIVTRDGTEATDARLKIRQVEDLLKGGAVELWFDRDSRTCSLVPKAPSGAPSGPA